MRPHNLRLRGFTCYSDEVEIDFSKMDLFVVSGPTGSGKSTIIDAICYALYGRVPRVDGTSALISHDRDEMFVHLEFTAGGELYRVLRSANRRRKTAKDGTEKVSRLPSSVQFERCQDGEWIPLGDRVRDIDQQIEDILGLDFNGFTRCIVLPQGQFQEFLSGDAQKRRELLTELLDIAVYARIMSAANGRAKSLEQEAAGIDRRLTEDYANATPEALEATRAELADLSPRLDAAHAQRDALQQAVELASRVMDARRREREANEQHAKALEEAARIKTLAAEGEQQLAKLRDTIAMIEAELATAPYDGDLHQALRRAEQQARYLGDLERELAAAQQAAASTAAVEQAKQALTLAQQASADAVAQREAAAAHREDVVRGQAAEHLRTGLKKGDTCPVCGGAVGTLPKTKSASIEAADKALRTAEAAEKKCAAALHSADLALARDRQSLEHARALATKLADDVESARKQLRSALPKGVAADRESITAALQVSDAAAAHQADLATKRDETRRGLDALTPDVARAATEISAREATAEQLAEQEKAAGAEAASAKAGLVKLTGAWCWDDVREAIEVAKNPTDLLRARLGACQAGVAEMSKQIGALETKSARIEEGIAKAAELRVELQEKRGHAALYSELGNVLRADHFQAFVIQEAMQALADSATQHLATLYDRFAMSVENNEFYVVDHWQADQRRPARTLSGGETFVASLALALALSERLPELRNRNAAVLESLFLDEGFGTLDPDVLEVVITALEGLRSEDRMVGIITHVPELARRIDARIEVTKSRAGSTAVVN